MKILCSTSMPYAREAFGTLGETTVMEGRRIAPEHVRGVDILAIRSTTKVNRQLLEDSAVKFVGTATIGIDHMEVAFLQQAGIAWCYAPGCNANSVSEYLTAALLCLARRHGFALEGRTIGVIGVGNVGSRVVQKAGALGLRVLQNDPPRFEATHDPVFRPLDEVLAGSDIVTLHVPLAKTGRWGTVGMADQRFFEKLKPGSVFINAARGGVVNGPALLRAVDAGIVSHAVIDTWEPEPAFPTDLLDRVDIATPHIAGHSFEGKVNGTVMVYREACRFLGVEAEWKPDALLPPPVVPEVRVDARGREDEEVLWDVVRRVYNIEEDDARLRGGSVSDEALRARHFDRLRREYPIRREFQFTRVQVLNGRPELRRKIAGLGFGETGPQGS
jgi:erythronate-4-phosphate dehydrogenase